MSCDNCLLQMIGMGAVFMLGAVLSYGIFILVAFVLCDWLDTRAERRVERMKASLEKEKA